VTVPDLRILVKLVHLLLAPLQLPLQLSSLVHTSRSTRPEISYSPITMRLTPLYRCVRSNARRYVTVSIDDASDVRPVDKIKPPMSRVAPSPQPENVSDEEPSLGRSNLLLDTEEKVGSTCS
jgi:hypothetical protein